MIETFSFCRVDDKTTIVSNQWCSEAMPEDLVERLRGIYDKEITVEIIESWKKEQGVKRLDLGHIIFDNEDMVANVSGNASSYNYPPRKRGFNSLRQETVRLMRKENPVLTVVDDWGNVKGRFKVSKFEKVDY